MGVPHVDWVALSPALCPALAAVLVLVVDLLPWRGTRAGRRALDAVALASLVLGLAALLLVGTRTRSTFCTDGGTCSYVASHLTIALQLLVLVAALVCVLLALADPVAREHRAELLMLMLAATAGACALAGARDLATFAVALETASLPIVGLVALRRDSRSAEAAVKLLLMVVTSFGLLALGIALLYASTGSLEIGAPISDQLGDLGAVHGLGLALVVAAVGFKLSLVPFHLWTPDTYAGAPLPVAAFLSTVSKVAGLSAVVIVLVLGAPERSSQWAMPVGAVAVLTMSVGNLAALRQPTAVRLLAWSTVAQAGWVLLPFAAGVQPTRLPGAVSASVAYLFAYVVATLAAFAVVARVAARHRDGARHRLDAYAGLWRTDPALALVLGFAVLCLAGLPPGVMGLVAKIVALVPVVGVQAWWLVAVAVANVVLGVAVYLRWAAQVFRVVPGTQAGPDAADSVDSAALAPAGRSPVPARLALSLAAAGCVALSVLPEGLIGLLGGSAPQ